MPAPPSTSVPEREAAEPRGTEERLENIEATIVSVYSQIRWIGSCAIISTGILLLLLMLIAIIAGWK